jgi:phage baseplate assembly protein W
MTQPIKAIHHPIGIDVGGGRLEQEADYEAYIRQLIRQVLLTAPGERINRPDFGAGIRRLVFAPNSDATASLTQTLVFEALNNWLGTLIRTDEVTAKANNERLDVTIVYTILARQEQRFLNLEVTI